MVVLGRHAGRYRVPTGFTIVGLEVDDETRGRVFAFFQSTIQVILLMVIALVPFIAGGFTAIIKAVTGSPDVQVGHLEYTSAGQNAVLLLAAVIVALGAGSSPTGPWTTARACRCVEDLIAAIRGEQFSPAPAAAASVNGQRRPPRTGCSSPSRAARAQARRRRPG